VHALDLRSNDETCLLLVVEALFHKTCSIARSLCLIPLTLDTQYSHGCVSSFGGGTVG